MAIDFAPEFGTKFTLTGPDGTIATFNDKTDANDVGVLTALTGLDSAEVRESGDVIVEFDGGVQGPGYYGRRPLVLEGLVYGHGSREARAAKLARLHKATNSMRGNSVLSWTPSVTGAVPVFLTLRKQQPLRIDGAWNKTFQAGMVAADPRIYSAASYNLQTNVPGATIVPTNEGNAEAWPTYTLLGPGVNPVVHNALSGLDIATSVTLALNDVVVIDTLNRTVQRGVRAPGSRTNYFPNPRMNSTTMPFTTPLTNTTVARVAASGAPSAPPGGGSFVLSSTRTTGTTMHFVRWPNTATPATAPGDVWTFAFDATGPVPATGPATINISFFTSGGSFLRTDTTTIPTGSITTSAWLRFAGTSLAAPATAAKVEVQLEIPSPTTGTSVYYTGFTMEKAATTGSYFDGSNPLSGHVAGWTGTTDDSTSSSFTTTADGVTPLTPWYSIINFASTRWSGLYPGANSLNITYTGTPTAGAAFRTDWRHTWL